MKRLSQTLTGKSVQEIPAIYALAAVRVVTPSDGVSIGIGFDLADSTMRIRLTIADALQLAELIRIHSSVCDGMPNLDVSKSFPVKA